MAEDARQLFLDVVLANDPTHFKPSDMPLLCRYAEANALAARAAAALLKAGPIVNGDDKPSPWLGVHAVATKEITALAMRLRLSPQARQPNNPKRPPLPVSYYDRMRVERAE
jgi:phage terminase small subunit